MLFLIGGNTKLRLILVIIFLTVAINPSIYAEYHSPSKHCTGIYVGKNLTKDGAVYLGQLGDESSSHWIEVIPGRIWEPNAVLQVGVTSEANYPGIRMEIPQVSQTYKYITVRYSEYKGFPPPLENGGLNECNVSVVDVWSPSRSELKEMTPKGQKGLSYSDEARIAMERAKSAREAVKIIGSLITQYGHATYGGNVHLIADDQEGWIMEEFAGGKGLWAAKRLSPDQVLVIRPGHMGNFPLDYKKNPNYMGSDNLISFAVEQGWYDPDSENPFNISEVYEEDLNKEKPGHQRRLSNVINAEQILMEKVPGITIRDIMEILRDRNFLNRGTKYGQIAQLRSGMPEELSVLWIAIGPPEASVFIPYFSGITEIPLEYREHRYLTKGEALRMELPRERQGQETTFYAYQVFDRLFMLTDEHFEKFHPEVMETIQAFEDNLISQQKDVEKIALQLFQSEKTDLANRFLTYYCKTEAMKGLRVAETLAESIELRTRLLFGIRPLPRIIKDQTKKSISY